MKIIILIPKYAAEKFCSKITIYGTHINHNSFFFKHILQSFILFHKYSTHFTLIEKVRLSFLQPFLRIKKKKKLLLIFFLKLKLGNYKGQLIDEVIPIHLTSLRSGGNTSSPT